MSWRVMQRHKISGTETVVAEVLEESEADHLIRMLESSYTNPFYMTVDLWKEEVAYGNK